MDFKALEVQAFVEVEEEKIINSKVEESISTDALTRNPSMEETSAAEEEEEDP